MVEGCMSGWEVEPVKVTQADRDLLKRLLMLDQDTERRIDAGLAYTAEVEMIAAHRIAERERCAGIAESMNGDLPRRHWPQ